MVSSFCSICHLRSSSTGVRRPTPAPHPVNNHQQPPLPCFCSFGTSSLFFLWFLFDKQLSTSLHSIPAWANDTNPCLPCTLSILWFCFSDFYKYNSSYVALHAFKKKKRSPAKVPTSPDLCDMKKKDQLNGSRDWKDFYDLKRSKSSLVIHLTSLSASLLAVVI